VRVGVLTGGGDVPGLNPCIKAIVNHAEDIGWEIVGFRRGWAGPLNVDPDDDSALDEWLQPLSRQSVRTIDRSGGTVLHTSRTNPRKVRPENLPHFMTERRGSAEGRDTIDCTDHVLKVMEHLGIDALIPIGGDDTLSYGAHLSAAGLPVIAVPKTMDNDVHGTDYCIGFSTAVSRSVGFIDELRTPAGSHERIAVIELFGRNSGETALVSGYLAGADRVLISEVPFEVERLAELVLEDRRANPSRYALVVLSEGASMVGGEVIGGGEPDAYGHLKLGGIGQITGDALKRLTGVGIVSQQLGYLMRAGEPDALDRMVAAAFGLLAVQQLEAGRAGVMIAVADGKYTTRPIQTCVQGVKRVDVDELYDRETYRPRLARVLGKPMFLY
jgi:6-phosphofructokinase 1